MASTPPPHSRTAHGPEGIDRGLVGILLGNALTLAVALWQQWSALDLLWPFFLQSLVIGYYARRRLLLAPQLTVDNMTINGKPVTGPEQVRRFLRWFFVLHYGGFHLGYAIFLLIATGLAGRGAGGRSDADWLLYAALGAAFWFAHRASHRQHVASDTAGPRSAAVLMAMPYLRIVPMHLSIIVMMALNASSHAPWFVAMFVALKTVADVGTHKLEHRRLQR